MEAWRAPAQSGAQPWQVEHLVRRKPALNMTILAPFNHQVCKEAELQETAEMEQ